MRPLALLLVAACGPTVDVTAPSQTVPDCRIDDDGQLSADELIAGPGVQAGWARNAPDEPFEPPGEGGTIDLTDLPDGIRAPLRTLQPDGAWWGDGVDWAASAAVEHPALLGLFRGGPDGVDAIGLASDGPVSGGRADTDLRYDVPLRVLALPLVDGASWGQTVTFRDARVGGAVQAGVEHWSFQAHAAGTVRLPGDIEVDGAMVVEATVERRWLVQDRSLDRRVVSWYAPCFGEVAAVTGPLEGPPDELRHLIP